MFVVPPLGGKTRVLRPPKGGTTNGRPVFPARKSLTAFPFGVCIRIVDPPTQGALRDPGLGCLTPLGSVSHESQATDSFGGHNP